MSPPGSTGVPACESRFVFTRTAGTAVLPAIAIALPASRRNRPELTRPARVRLQRLRQPHDDNIRRSDRIEKTIELRQKNHLVLAGRIFRLNGSNRHNTKPAFTGGLFFSQTLEKDKAGFPTIGKTGLKRSRVWKPRC